jgi:hypothetical protein
MPNTNKSLSEWVDFLSHADIPVLKYTSRELARLQLDEDSLSGRAIFSVVVQDPMMVFRLLRYMQTHKHKSQLQDLVQIEHIVMMLGTEKFFQDIPAKPIVEEVLHDNLPALTHLLRLVHRAHKAAHYALDWAVRLYDLHAEEIRTAALLHDLSEILMWCFAPDKMMEIFERQHADKTLRSQAVQQEVLGFRLLDLQLQLAEVCQLPPLLLRLMKDGASGEQRVRNVTLAVNLARHASHGWDDAALPDDYRDISELLRVDVSKVRQWVGAPAIGEAS